MHVCMYIRDTAHINIHEISFGSIDSRELALYSPRSLDWCSPNDRPEVNQNPQVDIICVKSELVSAGSSMVIIILTGSSREIHIW